MIEAAEARTAEFSQKALACAVAIGERLLDELELPPVSTVNCDRIASSALAGTVGYALFFSALAQATGQQRWTEAFARQAREAIDRVGTAGPSLFYGASGVRAMLRYGAAGDANACRIVERCDRYVGQCAPVSGTMPLTYEHYDVACGASGVRLARSIDGPTAPDAYLRQLEWLVEAPDRWGAAHPLREADGIEHNIGLAHGLPSIVAAIVLTAPQLSETTRAHLARVAELLIRAATRRNGLITWARSLEHPEPERFRAVWCYGTAGVATALLEYGARTGDTVAFQFAVDAFDSMLAVGPELWECGELGICHGASGVALMLWNAGRLTGDARYAMTARALMSDAVAQLQRNAMRTITRGLDTQWFDALGLDLGITGVGLTLLTLSGSCDTRWTRLFAIGEPIT